MSWDKFIDDVHREIAEFVKIDISSRTPWDILQSIKSFPAGDDFLEDERFDRQKNATLRCGKNCQISSNTVLDGNIVLGDNVFIGNHCLLRGPLFIGSNSVIGRGHEITRSVILSNASLGHSSVVLDSIIGRNCWLGAYVGTCNKRLDRKPIKAFWNDQEYQLPMGTSYGCIIGHDVRLGVSISCLPGSSIADKYMIYGPQTIAIKEWDH